MFKLALIPFILLFGGIFFFIFAFIVYRKIKRGVKYTYDKGAEISAEYFDKRRNQEIRNKLPTIVQKGLDDYKVIEKTIEDLPPVWQLKLMPLKRKADSLLNEISYHLINDESFERSKFNSVRSFFNHTLDTLKQLTLKLKSHHRDLSDADAEKARDNIKLIYEDMLRHEKTLHKSQKFDFDVVMDVIKARLKG